MQIGHESFRSIWIDESTDEVRIIDQTALPHAFETLTLHDVASAAAAIREMRVRGAPLIGATAAHGLALALASDASDDGLNEAARRLVATRPTAVNLRWAIDRVRNAVEMLAPEARAAAARREAIEICDEDVTTCESIGEHGLRLLEALADAKRGEPLQILTHCNAGWLATVDWGTALAPLYKAHLAGMELHVWVDETRPRNQGASLTAFELGQQGIAHTVVVDNAGGHLMQQGLVDAVFVGSDRTTAAGDVCNKIGTYLKALAARESDVPFYVALPTSTIDWTLENGHAEIPIEERDADEVRLVRGRGRGGDLEDVEILPPGTSVANPGFDVTPAHLVTSLVTEHGAINANPEALASLRERI